jgi:putative ABC transport system substrate-binding protein
MAMRRREFIAGTAALSFAQPAWAQTNARPSGVKRIAIFHTSDKPESLTSAARPIYKVYFDELKRLGFVEGQNLIVDRYSALGDPNRYGEFARQIIATRPDVIFPFGVLFINEVMALAPSLPMVGVAADPIAFGLSTSLAKPDRNYTGVVIDAGLEIWAKRVQLLQETVGPQRLSNVGFLLANPTSRVSTQQRPIEHVREAARQIGIKATLVMVVGNAERAAYERGFGAVVFGGETLDGDAYERSFAAMGKEGVDGLVVNDSSEHATYSQAIVDLAARFRIPTIYPFRYFAVAGGLMSYGSDLLDLFRRVATMTGEVLNGVKPADIPFYRQTKYDLVLNQKTARSLGLEFAPTLFATADTVIE